MDPLVKPFAHLHNSLNGGTIFTSKCTSLPMSSNNINIIIECRYSRFRSIVMFEWNSHLTTKYITSMVSTITLAKFSFTTLLHGTYQKKHLSIQVPFKARKEHNHLVSCQQVGHSRIAYFFYKSAFQESHTPLEGQFGTTFVFIIEKEMEHIARINKNWHSILK